MDKVITRIINDSAIKYGVDFKTAELVYTDMFRFIRKTLEAVDFATIESEDDLRVAKVNFNIPRIFKMYTTKSRIDYAREAIRKSDSEYDERVSAGDDPKAPRGFHPNIARSIRIE